MELRGDFPRVGRQEPYRSWRKVCYLLRADARVHSGKLSRVTDDQADPGDAQATAERECVAKGGGQYTMYILNYNTRLGPNVNNDLASRLKRIEWGLLLNQMLSCTRGNRTSRTTPKLQPRNAKRFLGEGGYAMVCRRTPSYTRSKSRLAMAVTRLSPP